MDTDEVIIEKIIKSGNSSDIIEEHVSNIEKNNYIPNISENCSSAYKENVQVNINENSHFTDDCEIIIIDNIDIEQSYNGKDNSNIQQSKSNEISNIKQNEIFINNISENQDTNKDIILENLNQKEDDDICIIHEKNIVPSAQTKEYTKVSSLLSIAIEYGNSDSETECNSDSEIECNSDSTKCENNQSKPLEEIQMQTYRQNKLTSSSEESDSEDDSTSSSDSSIVVESNESDSDDSSIKKSKANNVKGQRNNEMKNELDDLPPIEDLKISVPEVLCDPLGEVSWMVEQLVVVKPKLGKPTLNLDTVLFVEKGQRTLGRIFDVFGQVNEPHYCVRFNNSNHIKECDIKVGMTVYYCPNTEYTSLVFLHELLKIKGIDAHADDPPEFSDDEEERVYYEQLKIKQTNNTNQTDNLFKRKRVSRPNSGWQSNHPWNRNLQNQKKGFYSRVDKQFFPMQSENQSQHLWSQSYQNNEPYRYGAHSLQSMQYMNHHVNSVNQNFYGPQNYYNQDGTTTYLNPRIPFSTCPRVSSGYLTLQSHQNVRFPAANMPWLPQVPQVPIRMKVPWIPLPPPPPPPPPTSSPSDTT